jgi:hypothetical protein
MKEERKSREEKVPHIWGNIVNHHPTLNRIKVCSISEQMTQKKLVYENANLYGFAEGPSIFDCHCDHVLFVVRKVTQDCPEFASCSRRIVSLYITQKCLQRMLLDTP